MADSQLLTPGKLASIITRLLTEPDLHPNGDALDFFEAMAERLTLTVGGDYSAPVMRPDGVPMIAFSNTDGPEWRRALYYDLPTSPAWGEP